jgi:LmbE family N-acetylglucosaminyl deacetylase
MLSFLKRLNPYYYRPYINQLLALRSVDGPYRFLVRSWAGISDANLAARVLETEFFKHDLAPVRLPVEQLKSIVVLAPHMDDETIGAGGSLLIASSAGVNVHIVFVTDSLHFGEDSDSGRIMEQEAREVCSRIGATMHKLNLSNLAPKPDLSDVDQLSGIINDIRPQVIMAPWVLDYPPKHRLVNHLLWLSHQRRPLPDCEVWGYQVHNTPYPNGYVDITEVAEAKRDLIKCYEYQLENFYRYDHTAMGLAAWNSRYLPNIKGKGKARYAELFFTLPLDEFLRMVESFYLSDLDSTYRGDRKVVDGASAIHQMVLQGTRARGFWGLGRKREPGNKSANLNEPLKAKQ